MQHYPYWELRVAMAGSRLPDAPRLLVESSETEPRIKIERRPDQETVADSLHYLVDAAAGDLIRLVRGPYAPDDLLEAASLLNRDPQTALVVGEEQNTHWPGPFWFARKELLLDSKRTMARNSSNT